MNCSSCGAAVADESLGFCTEWGETFGAAQNAEGDASDGDFGQQEDGADYGEGYDAEGDGSEGYDEEPQGPSAAERLEQLSATVMGPVGAVSRSVGDVFQSVLDDPGLRGVLPGGSLTLAGLGVMAVALLLWALPFIAGGLGPLGAGVMVVWGVLAGLNEWYVLNHSEVREGRSVRPMPAALENLPRELWHPGTAWLFALLTCTYAFWVLGSGVVSLLWLVAAVLIGYEQGQRYFLAPREEGDEELEGASLGHYRWVILGAVLCCVSLLLPWSKVTNAYSGTLSGRQQPLSPLTLMMLLLLICSVVRNRSLNRVHPLVLLLIGVWLLMWPALMMSPYYVGPWVYLPGLLLIEGVIGYHFMRLIRGPEAEAEDSGEESEAGSEEEPSEDEEQASDLKLQS